MTNIIGWTEIICENCRQAATVRKYDNRQNKFCSNHCSNIAHNPKIRTVCSIIGCAKPEYGKGLCQMHAWRLKHYGDVNFQRWQKRPCVIPGCPRSRRTNGCHSDGMCNLHRIRLRRHGTLEKIEQPFDPKKYRVRKYPGHVLCGSDDRAYVHRVVLFNKIGPGKHPCHWCGFIVRWDRRYPKHANALIADHIDHNRQNNEPDNLVPSCNPCNSKRRRAQFVWEGTTEQVGS